MAVGLVAVGPVGGQVVGGQVGWRLESFPSYRHLQFVRIVISQNKGDGFTHDFTTGKAEIYHVLLLKKIRPQRNLTFPLQSNDSFGRMGAMTIERTLPLSKKLPRHSRSPGREARFSDIHEAPTSDEKRLASMNPGKFRKPWHAVSGEPVTYGICSARSGEDGVF